MTSPFDYPDSPHQLRHGPSGYVSYESYRPWLRDEYSYRCVYCLHRERWSPTLGFEIDHFVAQANAPESRLSFDNLVYACARCNSVKSARVTFDPRLQLIQKSITIDAEGRLHGQTLQAQEIIRCLRLNRSDAVEFRSLMLKIVDVASTADQEIYLRLMSYPDDLPDLAQLRPTANSRPEGVAHSAHARRHRGELPDVY